jgi:hypothetical protein
MPNNTKKLVKLHAIVMSYAQAVPFRQFADQITSCTHSIITLHQSFSSFIILCTHSEKVFSERGHSNQSSLGSDLQADETSETKGEETQDTLLHAEADGRGSTGELWSRATSGAVRVGPTSGSRRKDGSGGSWV